MSPNNCADWLYGFQTGTDWFLACGDALQRATANFRNPHSQFPSTVLLIGKCEKDAACRALLQGRTYSRSRGIAQLQADNSTANDEYPLLVASLDIDKACSQQKPLQKHNGNLLHKVRWQSEHLSATTTETVVEIIVGKLLLLFIDVVCLFLDDFSSPEEGIHFLQRCGHHSSISQDWRPQVIFVSNRTYRRKGILSLPMFSGIQRVSLPKESRKALCSSRFFTLKKVIDSSMNVVRKSRDTSKTLYSANHLNAFFELALRHVATCASTPFNFIIASRQRNRIEKDFGTNLRSFLALCTTNHVNKEAALKYIASALMLDSLPPGMHHFKPSSIFESLYQSPCYDVFSSLPSEQGFFPASSCKQLKVVFSHFCCKLKQDQLTAVQMHRRNLQDILIDWCTLQSTQVCLYCIFRKPEHRLRCGHALCDSCACRYGLRGQQMEYLYRIPQCILCLSNSELVVRLKPPTAGSRLLVLDGGGIRGILTLHILQALDEYRQLPYPIYDEFDLALGTSTGGLIVLMFLLRRSLNECIDIFKQLSRLVFTTCPLLGNSFFTNMYRFLYSLLTDSFYGAANMEACVKKAFGSNTALFSSTTSNTGISGLKVAVTTTTVSDSRLCILSNYNGSGVRKGYQHYRASYIEEETLICDAARATSAAPSYFPAKFIQGIGFLQDGGAGKHNNPIDPAEWESKAIWDNRPDLVVSIGTGFARDSEVPQTVSRRLGFRDRFFSRLFRLFNAMLNAQDSWEDHLNRVPFGERHRYFRVNIALSTEPELDDVSKMSDLEDFTATFLHGYNFSSIAQALFAAAFFFELYQKPATNRTLLVCCGSIRCRSPDTRALIERILQEYPDASFTMEDGTSLGRIGDSSLCTLCGHYRKAVKLKVHHADQMKSIYLQFNQSNQTRISGFPQSMSHFARLQQLDAEFGRSDHQVADYLGMSRCQCKTSRKRKNSKSLKTKISKRRCPGFIIRKP